MMNDEKEPFEQRLSRQPLRPVPADWRAGILRAAQAVQLNEKSLRLPAASQTGWRKVVERELRALVWPNPKAWAGLAAVWALIAIINFSMRDTTPQITEKSAPPSPAALAELRNQQRMFVELSGQDETQEADRQKNMPLKPHSEREEFRLI
jgi:hypothetical protein